MRAILLALMAAACVAAVISGVVLDAPSGYPVSRATVTAQPWVDGRAGKVQSKLTDRGGRYTFAGLPAASYLITATRAAYAVAEYGQRSKSGPGALVPLGADDSTFLELRLRRMCAISGQVVDENFLGLPDYPVNIFTARRPYRRVGQGKTDDRGNFRVGKLDPGRYFVRAGALDLEDGAALVPKFAPASAEVKDARVYRVRLDEEATDVQVQPRFGELSTLEITVNPIIPALPATITLASDVERRTMTVMPGSTVVLEKLPPGLYEVTGEIEAANVGHHLEVFTARHSKTAVIWTGRPVQPVEVSLRGSAAKPDDYQLWIRRKDLDSPGPLIRVTDPQMRLTPGYYEFAVRPREGLVAEPRSAMRYRGSRAGPSDEWMEFHTSERRVPVVLSDRVTSVSGRVLTGTSTVIAGAPVYLLPADDDVRRAMNGHRMTRTDDQGRYKFDNLPAAAFVIASSFEFEDIDLDALESKGKRVQTASGGTTQDLDLYRVN